MHVATDAIGSRVRWNWDIGIDRMRAAGAVISTTEMMIYELLRSSGTAQFKQMLPLSEGLIPIVPSQFGGGRSTLAHP